MKKSHLSLALVAAILAIPTIVEAGGRIVDFARNAHRVDGFHAVGAKKSPDERARKLVATNAEGRLPDDIIQQAPDAARLQGFSSGDFVHRCGTGAVSTVAEVPGDVPADWTRIGAFAGVLFVGGSSDPFCDQTLTGLTARRLGLGVYEVAISQLGDVAGSESGCPRGDRSSVGVVVTVHAEQPLIAAHTAYRCANNGPGMLHDVRIFDINGNPVDASFTLAQFGPVVVQAT